MNPKFGFIIESHLENMMWLKNKFFESGISPHEFRKCQMRDINDIINIKDALNEKRGREREVQNLINSMK